MRGKAQAAVWTELSIRITPAYAGKRAVFVLNFGDFWDHPRLCGEKSTARNRFPDMTGSPPPMRGKAPVWYCSLHTSRITPAYAGKSVLAIGLALCGQDHPRLCGEKLTHTALSLD